MGTPQKQSERVRLSEKSGFDLVREEIDGAK
jgi:hypothetical protein